MNAGCWGDKHVVCHSAVGNFALKAKNIMHFAHPVFTGGAIAAAIAGHDLLCNDTLTNCNTKVLECPSASLNDMAVKLVTRNHRRFHPCRLTVSAPEHCGTRMAFAVARANSASADLDHQFIGASLRPGSALKSVVLGAVAHHGLHRIDDIFHSSSNSGECVVCSEFCGFPRKLHNRLCL